MTTPTRQNQTDAAAWHVIPFPASFGAEVCAWRYPAPYNVYNWPSWDELVQRGDEFADPHLRAAQYVAVVSGPARADGAEAAGVYGVGAGSSAADTANDAAGIADACAADTNADRTAKSGRTDNANAKRACEETASALIGYGQLFPLADETGAPIIRLGLGLRPELCGHGRGARLVALLAAEAQRRVPGCTIDLEVLAWNERAIRAYRKAGFALADAYTRDTPAGPAAFYCMVLARE